MRLVIFGPQGGGKGTQSARIAEKYDLEPIATGDLFRWAISHDTEVGHKAQEFVKKGRLVPDEITIEVVRERLEAKSFEGFLLDGFPRNIAQARALDGLLEGHGASLDAAIVLEVPEDESLRRIVGRRVCLECGRNYHLDSPPQRNWTCDRCGGRVEKRSDDDEETVRERLRNYYESTEPLKLYYEERGVLRRVDGVGNPDEVFDRIASAL